MWDEKGLSFEAVIILNFEGIKDFSGAIYVNW